MVLKAFHPWRIVVVKWIRQRLLVNFVSLSAFRLLRFDAKTGDDLTPQWYTSTVMLNLCEMLPASRTENREQRTGLLSIPQRERAVTTTTSRAQNA
ncbi:hypothetical protein ColTof4_13077 [Colletotrichum tofieldiae]|nr:hypothetical protein ColTof3_00291 [Colletotrichum tofieldiae]GKT80654.1 hypothetical protein ColTof4_13077 [Colletotrichum tofieldiae]